MPKRMEAAWKGFEAACVPAGASSEQRRSIRLAFYGGASVLFAEIMGMLEPGTEPTPADLRNMDALARELMEFAAPPTATGGVN